MNIFTTYSVTVEATTMQSAEHATLLQCADRLIGVVSVNPLPVARKLLEAGLVTQDLIDAILLSKSDHEKATELVLQVIKIIKNSPEKFEVLMKILETFPWMSGLVGSMKWQCGANKNTQGAAKKVWRAHTMLN